MHSIQSHIDFSVSQSLEVKSWEPNFFERRDFSARASNSTEKNFKRQKNIYICVYILKVYTTNFQRDSVHLHTERETASEIAFIEIQPRQKKGWDSYLQK